MTRRLYKIAGGVVLLVVLFLSIRGCQDRKATGTRAVATQRVTDWKPQYDSAVRELAVRDHAVARLGDSLSSVLARKPVVVTRTIQVSGEAWVPRTDFDAVAGRLDSTRTVATAYRDTVNAYRLIPPTIVAAADTVIKYQKVLIDVPKPRRRWGLGIYGGYGATKSGADVKAGPQLGVGLSYSF